MQLVDRVSQSPDSPNAKEELTRGIELLRQALAINPANWAAYWMIGKAHQALANSTDACEAFGKSFGLHKTNVDVAREYMFECLKLGQADKAVAAARHAVRVKPDDAGLMANLGLAQLICGHLAEAADSVAKALEWAPNDRISQNLRAMIADVQAGRKPQPATLADLSAN